MDLKLEDILNDNYEIRVGSIRSAPRQFVAKTFVIEADSGDKYFCKVIDKRLFIANVIKSLPALRSIHQLGFERINYPIPAKSGALHVMYNTTLVVLFNFIDAPQSYDYDDFTFGQTIANVHKLTTRVSVELEVENFEFRHKGTFEEKLQTILSLKQKNSLLSDLSSLIRMKESEIRRFFANFLSLAEKCKSQEWNMVVTHGDAPGNILVKSAKDIYIIDWDDIMLTPPERDTWFLEEKPRFIDGYKSIFPRYQRNQIASKYFVYSRYFNDLVEYWEEIINSTDKVHQQKNLSQMTKELFNESGWLYPQVK